MRRIFCTVLLVALFLAAACSGNRPVSPGASLERGEIPPVQVGMTKQQVISAMGRPSGVKAHGRHEYYCYDVAHYGVSGDAATIYVKHEDNLVVGYGRVNHQNNCD